MDQQQWSTKISGSWQSTLVNPSVANGLLYVSEMFEKSKVVQLLSTPDTDVSSETNVCVKQLGTYKNGSELVMTASVMLRNGKVLVLAKSSTTQFKADLVFANDHLEGTYKRYGVPYDEGTLKITVNL
jgi:hypothetical protein